MNNNLIADHAEREQALDPRQSFIVQAPAGSGKTELLTQRFLRLLACVNEPEEILAITFTKKAASEMRSRVRDALKKAQNEPQPSSAHQLKTWQLAQNAIKQDQARNWGLLTNPNRLRIKTIDAFNTLLTRQLPLLSHFGASPEILDYPRSLFREAAQAFLMYLEGDQEWSQAIALLLLHLDNNIQAAEDLMVEMLGKRDQWLPHILAYHGSSPSSLRPRLEANLAAVIEETLQKVREAIPEACVQELLGLLRFAAANVITVKPESRLRLCADLTELPDTHDRNKEIWLGIAELLLTQGETWRKSLDKNCGFPAAEKKNKDQDINALNKDSMKALIEELSQHENLHSALVDLLYLPNSKYSNSQWEILEALQVILKVAVAQLHVSFKLSGKIDYTENALAALQALGQDESPTDLALVLDYQLKHILVDEFQDTSNNQYELLKKLVHGWQPGDGRSLFLVGDPMQSIYRFREAEVGLFLRARELGIGPISLVSLTLSVNFRSTPQVVEWINTHFNRVLPDYNDIASGAVSYTPSIAGKKSEQLTPAIPVELHCFDSQDTNAQTQGIIHVIQQTLAQNPQDSIAILVRSRSHLKLLIPALKAAQLPYQAVEIDPLQSRPVIQDLLALTRALLYPADAVAWLAILRAPWCGLSLSDLLALAGERKQELIWQRAQNPQILSQLSPQGQERLQRILPILQRTITERHREDLHHWVETIWTALGGPACLDHESDLQDARVYFNLLKKLTYNESSLDLEWPALEEALNQLYAQAQSPAECRIQIMTIHNAKGLEFDSVILPQLEKGAGKNEKALMSWLAQPLANDATALIMAPIHGVGEEEDSIYHYLRRQDKSKTQHEQGRLLYVAATRAKKALHLCMNLESKEDGEIKIPADGSMLKKLWPAVQQELVLQNAAQPTNPETKTGFRVIKRLKTGWSHPITLALPQERPAHNKIPGFHLSQHDSRIIGIVVHYLLQQISAFGFEWWQEKSAAQQASFISGQLLKNQATPSMLNGALKKVEQALHNILADPKGQWLLGKHSQAQAEFALISVINGETKKLVIDKTFVDEKQIRWIIDYKTSVPDGESLDTFLVAEKKKYLEKMQQYQQALGNLFKEPIRMGLYFPLIPAWSEW